MTPTTRTGSATERSRHGKTDANTVTDLERELREIDQRIQAARRTSPRQARRIMLGDLTRQADDLRERRWEAIEEAIARLFTERPEYRTRHTGQITCALAMFDMIPETFPRGVEPGGPLRDNEVLAILEENGVEAS